MARHLIMGVRQTQTEDSEMTSTKLIVILLLATCMLAGWIAGQAVDVPDVPVETVETDPPPARDCHFEIPVQVRIDGSSALLDQCTGDTWRFDSGWDYDTGSYVRGYSWVAIERE